MTETDIRDDDLYFDDEDFFDDDEPQVQEVETEELSLTYHEKFAPLYDENHPYYYARYMLWYGGRGGRKSWEIASGLLIRGLYRPLRIICAREYQNSIADSVLALLEDRINDLNIQSDYTVQKTTIFSRHNNTQFVFKGLAKSSAKSIKSFEGANLCWIEEAQTVSKESLKTLTPTIRKTGSQIIASFNPDLDDDPIYELVKNPQPGSYVCKINYTDNKDCPVELIREAEWMKMTDKEAYENVWLGETRKNAESQILRNKWRTGLFEPNILDDAWEGPYYGNDWGFSVDPMATVECWVVADTLFVYDEKVRVGVEIEEIPAHLSHFEGIKSILCRADCARPELISYACTKGYMMIPAEKWDGCVEDGISALRSFKEIVVHEKNCPNTIFECKYYSYKVDRMTNEVLPVIVDKHNHCIDAIRYALEPIVKNRKMNYKSWTR